MKLPKKVNDKDVQRRNEDNTIDEKKILTPQSRGRTKMIQSKRAKLMKGRTDSPDSETDVMYETV